MRSVLTALGAAVLIQVGVLVGLPLSHAGAASPALLYIFAGQSNMVGAGTSTAELSKVDPTLHASPANVRFWGPTEDTPRQWGPTEPPTEVQGALSHMGFGPEISAAPLLSKLHPQATIGLVKVARGSTNLVDAWNPKNPLGMYALLLTEVRAAKERLAMETNGPVRIAGFFWLQGESDSARRSVANSYGRNLTNFISTVRSDLNAPRMPFVIAEIPEFKQWYPAFPYCSVVQSAERSIAKQVSRTFYVPTADLERDPSSPVHFSTRGTVYIGRRLVNARFGL